MIRVFPPEATLNVSTLPFQLEKDSGVLGTFSLSSNSDQSKATVTPDGLVSLLAPGQVFVELISEGSVVATSSITIAELPVQPSHLRLGYDSFSPISYTSPNSLSPSGTILLFPEVVFSDRSTLPYTEEIEVLLSRDGIDFYSISEYKQFIPEVTLEDRVVSVENRVGYRLSHNHALAQDLVVRLVYQNSFIQDYYFSLQGPISVSYSPIYEQKSFEVDIDTTLSIEGLVHLKNGTTSAAVSYASLTPDIISVDSVGNVMGIRSASTEFPTFSRSKNNLDRFIQTKDKVYVAADNKILEFNSGSGYGSSIYESEQGITVRGLSHVQKTALYFYTSVKQVGESHPKSVVFRLFPSQGVSVPVAYVHKVATAFSIVRDDKGLYFGLLATESNNLTELYLFSHGVENVKLDRYLVRLGGIVKQIVAGQNGWAFLLFENGNIASLNIKTLSYHEIGPLNLGASCIDVENSSYSNKVDLWAYGNNILGNYSFLKKTTVTDGISNSSFKDYGTIRRPREGWLIKSVSVIDSVHHVVFIDKNPLDIDYADPPPDARVYEILEDSPGDTYYIDSELGVVDLSKPVYGTLKIASAADPTVFCSLKVKVNSRGTKYPYAIYNSTGLDTINVQTSIPQHIPVSLVFSDGTSSGGSVFDRSEVLYGSGVSLSTGSGLLYAKSDNYRNSKIFIATSLNTGLSLNLDVNFYPVATGVGIGFQDRVQSSIRVTKGSVVSLPSYIFINDGTVYGYPLIVGSSNKDVARVSSNPSGILVQGLEVGSSQLSYRTPQPIGPYISGNIPISVVPVSIPERIYVLNQRYGTIEVPYRPASLVNPTPESYPVSISGQLIYSDGSRKPYNSEINFSIVSGSENFFITGNSLSFYPPTSGTNPTGTLRVQSEISSGVFIDIRLLGKPSEDLTPYRLIFPPYVEQAERFVKFSSIPQGRVSFNVLRANNTVVFGNPLAEFSVSGESVRVIPNSFGALEKSNFGNSTLHIKVGSLEDTIFVQVGGPESIKPNLPFFKVDAGASLGYVSGTILDVNGSVLDDINLVISSSKENEVSDSVSGILRGSYDRYLPQLPDQVKWSSSTDSGDFSYLNNNGVIVSYNADKLQQFSQKFNFGDRTPDLFDLPRHDLCYVVYNNASGQSLAYIERKDGTTSFKPWGYISGTVKDISIIGQRVYITRSGTVGDIGFIPRSAYSPRKGKTLDYAFTYVSGIPYPNRLVRDFDKLVCTNNSGNSFIVYNRNEPTPYPIQIFSGVTIASSGFGITSDLMVVNNQLQSLGTLPSGAEVLSAARNFFTKDSQGYIYVYNPNSSVRPNLIMNAEGFSTQTRTLVPIEVLPENSRKDYYIEVNVPDEDLIYIGESRTLDVKVYNSSGLVHKNVSIYLNGDLVNQNLITFKTGGVNVIKIVSRDSSEVYIEKSVSVRRRVKAIKVNNFLDDNGILSVNSTSTLKLEALVLYEDGYTDSRLSLSVPESSQNFLRVSAGFLVEGLEQTEGGFSASLRLTAEENKVSGQAQAFLDVAVKVYPAGTKKLSYLELKESISANEQSTVNPSQLGANLFYTDGTSEPIYEEGFVESLEGLKLFSNIIDLCVDDSDFVYVLHGETSGYYLDKYTSRGALVSRETISLSAPLKVRFDGGNKYILTSSELYRVEQSSAVAVFGTSIDAVNYNFLDFYIKNNEIAILDVNSERDAGLLILQGGQTSQRKSLTNLDIIGFTKSSSGKLYFLSSSLGVLDENEGIVIPLAGATGIAAFEDEIYVALNHRIVRILLDGTVDYLAGSVFSGLSNGSDSLVRFNNPTALSVDRKRRIFIADYGNRTLRRHVNGVTTALVGGFWSSANPEIAIGQGPSLQALKPGVTTLTISYLNVQKSIKVSVIPIYTSIKIDNQDLFTVFGEESSKKSITLTASLFTESGLATGNFIESINYPAKVNWSCDRAAYLSGNVITPTILGQSVVTATISGISPTKSVSKTIDTVYLAVTGVEFSKQSYYLKVNDNYSFADEVDKLLNDGQRLPVFNAEFIGTNTIDGDFTATEEYDGVVSTTVSGITANTRVYVYNSGMGLSFDTSTENIYLGTSRDISAFHTGTELFQKKLISYTLDEDLSKYGIINASGIFTAVSSPIETVSGSVTATSLALNTSEVKMINVVRSDVFSSFIKKKTPYVIHSGSLGYIKLSDISVDVVSSLNKTIAVPVNDNNFKLPEGAKSKISSVLINNEPVSVITYEDSGSLSVFSAVYTHGLNSIPAVIKDEESVDVPFISVYPVSVVASAEKKVLDKIYLIENDSVIVNLAILYDTGYIDFSYEIESSSGQFIAEKLDDNGNYRLTAFQITEQSLESSLSCSYNFDKNLVFKIPVIITKVPTVRSVDIVETTNDIICLELENISSLSALVRLTDNTISSEGYEWIVTEDNTDTIVQGEILKLESLANGVSIAAISKEKDFDGNRVQSNSVTVYQKVSNIDNPEDLLKLGKLGLLNPKITLNFEPKFQAKINLEATLPAIIKPVLRVNSVEKTGSVQLEQNSDNMLDSSLTANFSRKTRILQSGSGIILGDSTSYTLFVEQGDKKALIQDNKRVLATGSSLSNSLDGFILEDGYSIPLSDSILFYNSSLDQPPFFYNAASSGASYQSGNEMFVIKDNNVLKISPDFNRSKVTSVTLGSVPSFSFSRLLVSPSSAFRYLTASGIALASSPSSASIIFSGSFNEACCLDNHKFAASSGGRLFVLDTISQKETYLGDFSENFGPVNTIQRINSGSFYVKTENGYTLSVSSVDNNTFAVASYTGNRNISDSLPVQVVTPPENKNYAIVFTKAEVSVKEKDSFKLQAFEFNTNGSYTELSVGENSNKLIFDPDYLRFENSRFRALKHGITVISGITAANTGTCLVSIAPIVTGIVIQTDYLPDPEYSTAITEGYYMPYAIRGVKSDGSLSSNIETTSSFVSYKNDLLYGIKETTAAQKLVIRSLDNPDVTTIVPIRVLPQDTTIVSNFKSSEPSVVSLEIGQSKFLDARVYYTNGTTDNFTTLLLDSSASGINAIDPNVILATGVDSGHYLTIKPSSASTFSKQIKVTSSEVYGKVIYDYDSNKQEKSFYVDNISNIENTFLNLKQNAPTISQIGDKFYDSIGLTVSENGINAEILFKPKYEHQGKTAKLQVLVSGIELSNAVFDYIVPTITPTYGFESKEYFITSNAGSKIAIKTFLTYDSTTRKEVKSEIKGNGIKVDSLGNYFLEPPSSASSASFTISATYKDQSAEATVYLLSGEAEALSISDNGNLVSSLVVTPYYKTEVEAFLSDKSDRAVKLTSVSSLNFATASSLTVEVSESRREDTYIPFSVSGISSGLLTGNLAYADRNFSKTLPCLLVDTKIKEVSLELNEAGNLPIIAYVGDDLRFSLIAKLYDGTQGYISAGYTNPDLLSGQSFTDTNTKSLLDLFDIYLGKTKLTDQFLISKHSQQNQKIINTVSFSQSSLTLFRSDSILPLTFRIKGTEKGTKASNTISIKPYPYYIEATNSNLDRFSR